MTIYITSLKNILVVVFLKKYSNIQRGTILPTLITGKNNSRTQVIISDILNNFRKKKTCREDKKNFQKEN